jgi:hypothetical protein
MTSTPDITIRRADEHDADSIARLAALDSTRAPRGLVLVAETDGELWAAISADDGHVAADPFRPSADSADLLRRHVASLAGARRARSGRRWLPLMPRAA